MAPKKVSKSTISAPTATTITATAYRFHLPALDIPTTSLADGTPIPAPPRESTPSISPPATPQTPLSANPPNPLRSHPTSSHSLSRKFSGDALSHLNTHKQASPPLSNGNTSSQKTNPLTKRPYTLSSSPASPTRHQPSKRPHIRKLLSLKSLASFNRSSTDLSKQSTSTSISKYSASGHYNAETTTRSQSPAPSSTNTSTSTLSKLKRRGSGAFWRRGSSSFGFGLGLVNEENGNNSNGGTSMVVGDENKAPPPPMLPELESVGETPDMDVKAHQHHHREVGHPVIRRQPSGWFGGERMFDGIGQR